MKRISISFRFFTLLIFFCLTASAQNFQTVRDGIEYAELTRQMTAADGKPEPVVFHLLKLDLSKVRLDVVHAMDAAIGLEKTSSIAQRYGASAAINAGFFRIDKSIWEGDDVSLLMINNELFSESINGRAAMMIANKADKTQVFIERVNVSDFIAINGKEFDAGRNRQRKENDLVIYSASFHATTLTDNNGVEFIIRNGRVSEILDRKGSSKIPSDGYVLSASGKMRDQLLTIVKKRTKIKLYGKHSSPIEMMPGIGYSISEDIVSGTPQLIKNGEIKITWQEEKSSKAFVETHHPRTAVAKLKDGRFLMVVVDGRSEASGGIGLPDLAAFLLEQGATDAMNLDGGGSSTMYLDGKVINKPSDKEGERKIGDAILVFPRKQN